MKRLLFVLFISSVAFITPYLSNAQADSSLVIPIHTISTGSDVVILGTVTSIASSAVTVGDDDIIVTDATVAVNEVIKGSSPGATVTVRVEGGTVAGITMRSTSTPPMFVGLRCVWFLSTVSSGRRTLIKGGQGLLELLSDDTVKGNRGLTLAAIRVLAN